jgi:hypothetical protein
MLQEALESLAVRSKFTWRPESSFGHSAAQEIWKQVTQTLPEASHGPEPGDQTSITLWLQYLRQWQKPNPTRFFSSLAYMYNRCVNAVHLNEKNTDHEWSPARSKRDNDDQQEHDDVGVTLHATSAHVVIVTSSVSTHSHYHGDVYHNSANQKQQSKHRIDVRIDAIYGRLSHKV